MTCGESIGTSRKVCDGCLGTTNDPEPWLSEGHLRLARLRKEGSDPAHGGQAARKRAEKMLAENGKSAEWDRVNARPDAARFREEILTGLQNVPLRAMAEATSLSLDYGSKIRRGLKTPHPRHWPVLAALAAQSG